MGSEFARDSALSPPESSPTDRPSIAAFCDAIRAKKDWSHKILDTTRNLGLKWATEAGIDDPANDGVFPALEYDISLSFELAICDAHILQGN